MAISMASIMRAGERRLPPHIAAVIALVLLAFLLRVAWVVTVNPDPLPRSPYDAAFYYNAALGLADGEGYRDVDDQQTNLLPPGYPLVLAGSYLVFGDDLLVGKLMNAFFGAVTVVLVYALAARMVDRRVALVAAGIMALFPSQIFFSTVLMTETLFVALSTLFLLLVMIWTVERQPASWQVLALGELLGVMTLVRAEAMLLVLALAVLWKVLRPSWAELGRYVALLLLGVVPLLLLWSIRNYVELGSLELRSGGGSALRTGLSPSFDQQLVGLFFGEQPAPLSDIFRHYATHPWDVAVVSLRKWAYLFHNESDVFTWIQMHAPPPLSPSAAARWSGLVNAYYYAVGFLAAATIACWLPALDRRRGVLLWFLLSWAGIYLIFVPQGRYHFPIVPVLAILAAFAVARGWQWAAQGGVARLAAALRTGELPAMLVTAQAAVTASRQGKHAPPAPGTSWRLPPQRTLVPVLAFGALVLAMTAIIVQGFVDPTARYRDAVRTFDLARLGQVIDEYYVAFGHLPSTGGLEQPEPFCVSDENKGCAFRFLWLQEGDFPSDITGDPETNGYWYASDGQAAVLYALRETDGGPACELKPPQLAGKGDLQCQKFPSGTSAGTGGTRPGG